MRWRWVLKKLGFFEDADIGRCAPILRSNPDRRSVILVEPVQAFPRKRLLPLLSYGNRNRISITKRGIERLLPELVSFPHHRSSALSANILIARKCGRRISKVFLQTRPDDITVLDCHDAALPQKWKSCMAGISE